MLRVAAEILHRVHESLAAKRSTVGLAVALIAGVIVLAGTLAHDAVPDDERGTLGLGLRLAEGFTNLVAVVAVYLLDKPSPRLIFLGRVFHGHHLGLCGELDVVGIIEHDEVVEAQCAGDAACALRDFLLHAAVGDVGIDGLAHHVAQTGLEKFGGDGGTHGKRVPLSQRPGSVLDAAGEFTLGVAGSHRAPLAELLQVVERELADECQLRVEHGSHVARVEEEAVAAFPLGIFGVVDEKFGVEHVDEVGSAHSTSGVARFGFFDH